MKNFSGHGDTVGLLSQRQPPLQLTSPLLNTDERA